MKLKEKISLVLFSDIEEKFLELILEGNIDDTLSLIEQVISPSEFKVFQQKNGLAARYVISVELYRLKLRYKDPLNLLKKIFKRS